MKTLIQVIRRWGPAIAVLAAVGTASFLYREALVTWFSGRPVGETGGSVIRGQAVGPFVIDLALQTDPPRVGDNLARIELRDGEGRPVLGALVDLAVSMPAMGAMPAMRSGATVEETAAGRYEAAFELSMARTWSLAVEIQTVDGRHGHAIFELATGRRGLRGTGGAGTESDIAFYTCTMHPSVKAADPGTCPICSMDLIPVTREELESGQVLVDGPRRQRIGVKTGAVERRALTKTIRAAGRVVFDETRLADVTLKFRAWIGEVHADYTGKRVEAGQPLFTVYGPELLAAQDGYLEAARSAEASPTRGDRLLAAARERLRLWGLADEQLGALAERGEPWTWATIRAPVSGTVVEKHIVAGTAMEAGRRLYRLADLTTVWVEADVYEYELPLIQEGLAAGVTLSYLPGRRFEGRVSFVHPTVSEATRTGRLRVEAANPDGALKPGMYADVSLEIPLGERLLVPESAVLFAGETRLVFLDRGEGRLEPRKIRTGLRDADWIEVLDGLAAGDSVVTSGQFLIAAESKLKSGMEQW